MLSVRTRDESGEQSTREFPQTWTRDDAQPVLFSTDIPIGENVDLVRVRALNLRCTCAEAQAPAAVDAVPE